MEEENKALIVASIRFLTEYIDSGYTVDSDIEELLLYLKQLAKKYIQTEDNVIKYTELVYERLVSITEGKDVVANTLGLSIGFMMLALENKAFKGSESMKVKRLVNSIYNKLELSLPNDTLETSKLIAKYGDIIWKEN